MPRLAAQCRDDADKKPGGDEDQKPGGDTDQAVHTDQDAHAA